MTTDHTAIITPNASADNAHNRPARLPRGSRFAAAIASAVISGVVLGGIAVGMCDTDDSAVVTAGSATTSAQA
jgi:hypothetical protein